MQTQNPGDEKEDETDDERIAGNGKGKTSYF